MDGIAGRAAQGDLMEILALQKKAFGPVAEAYGDMEIPPMVQTYEGIAEEYKKSFFLKYVIGGHIAGSVRGYLDHDNKCQVCRLIVDPDHQNKGIGKKLMSALEETFPDCGGYALFTGAERCNEKAIAFYTSLGYALTSQRPLGDVLMVFMDKPNDHRLRPAEERDLAGIHVLYDLAAEWLNTQGIRQWNTDVYPTYETARRGLMAGHLYCIGENPAAATMILNDVQPREYGDVTWQYPGKALVIHTLVVHPGYAGQGLGRRMLRYAERRAAEGGYDCIRIDVFPGNPAAVRLYTKYGFEYAGEIVFEHKEPGYEVYHCYEKQIV